MNLNEAIRRHREAPRRRDVESVEVALLDESRHDLRKAATHLLAWHRAQALI